MGFVVQGVYAQINQAEYFYDTDPGIGHGTPITLTTDDSVDISVSLPTTGLSAGIHNLYIRTRNTNNRWSLYTVRNFYVYSAGPVSSAQVVSAEYFIDTDPGVGNGTAISPSFITADSIDVTRAISSVGLSAGLHRLHIRTKNSAGLWSHAVSDSFVVCTTPSVAGTISGASAVCVGGSTTLTNSAGFWYMEQRQWSYLCDQRRGSDWYHYRYRYDQVYCKHMRYGYCREGGYSQCNTWFYNIRICGLHRIDHHVDQFIARGNMDKR